MANVSYIKFFCGRFKVYTSPIKFARFRFISNLSKNLLFFPEIISVIKSCPK
jgi:hypothetical protein